MQINNQLTYINKSSLALGFFDGMHLGHSVVVKNTIHLAQEYNVPSCIILFKNHPLSILTNHKIEQILTLDEKLEMLEKIGIDNVILLDFEKFSTMRAKDYLENVLIKYFSPRSITTGFNHSFGFNKEGDSNFLRENQEKYNYKYFEVPPFVVNENIVSSSIIRNMLHLGNFTDANKLLGYNYFINGRVIEGEKIASNLGFPSANIIYPQEKVQIPQGVYYVLVSVGKNKYNGILNHGFAPTIDNNSYLKTEVHILNFDRNIYNEQIKIEFITKIRNQIKFENTEKLKEQINRDIAFAEIYKYFMNVHIEIPIKKFLM